MAEARAGASLSRAAATLAVATAAAALGVLYVASTILTPLYPLYEKAFGFGELVVTEIYSTYLIGNLLVLFLLGKAAAVLALPETVEHRARSLRELSLKPRLGVPKELRLRFVAPAATAFAVFALAGFYGSLTPGLLARRLHEPNIAVLGAVVGAFFGSASALAAFVPRAKPEAEVRVAVGLLFGGLALLVAADLAVSFPLLLVATFVSGGALGLGYRGSLQAINEMAPAEGRAELVSSYLLACYTANALPALGVGILSRAVKPEVAHAVFAGVLAALGIVALVAGGLEQRRMKAAA